MRSLARFFVRLSAIAVFDLAVAAAANGAPSPTAGAVTDATGAALPRVAIRLVDASSRTVATTISDASGRFQLELSGCAGCTVEAALAGFRTARVPAAAAAAIVLAPAPVTESVVVSATREPAPAGAVGASVTVFTADDIARRGTMLLSDLVRETPGVAVIQNGGAGGVTSFFLRGGESNYTKVLVDGVPLNEPGGTFNFGGLTTTNLSRVEVVRGAQSALFGSDAMSGVIQLFTRRGVTRPPAFEGTLEGGTYATQRGTASLAGVARGWDYSIGLAGTTTDNRAPHNRLTNGTVSWTAGGTLRPHLELRTVGRIESGRVGTPGQTAFGSTERDAYFDHQDAAAGVSLKHEFSEAWTERAAFSVTRTRQDSRNLTADPDWVPSFGGARAPFAFSDFTYDSTNLLRREFVSYQLDGRIRTRVTQLVTALVDWDGERATLTDRMASAVVRASRDNTGVSLQHQLVGRRGSLSTSARFEHNGSFGDRIAPRISGALIARQAGGGWGELAVKANAGRGIKEPTILQSFSPNVFFQGNPRLLPEIATSWDVGVTQRLAGDRVRVDVVYFDNKYVNQISTITTDFNTFAARYFNVGDTNARGLELSGEGVITLGRADVRFTSGYTLTDSKIVRSTSEFSAVIVPGAWAFRRPRHAAFARAAASWRRARMDLDGQYVGKRVDSDFASLSPAITWSGRYWLWNASASVRAGRSVELYLRVQNLGDTDYMEPLGYEAWRRTVHAGARVTF